MQSMSQTKSVDVKNREHGPKGILYKEYISV
jgi:hypothetical protein